MPIIAKESSGDFTPAPEGLHQAVCVDVVDLGMQDNPFQPGQKRRRVRIVWQINELMENGDRFTASRIFTNSLNEQGALRPSLEAWRGRSLICETACAELAELPKPSCGRGPRTAERPIWAK